MDLRRLLTAIIAQWMRDAKLEPNSGTAVRIGNQVRAVLEGYKMEFDGSMGPYLGCAFQAVEIATAEERPDGKQPFEGVPIEGLIDRRHQS